MDDAPELSEAVQRALLPSNLPEIEGWSIATIYEPAGPDLLVGGDFYDWFRRPDGTWSLLLGDVMGKGSMAAALGMSIRKGLKALAFALPTVEEAVRVLEVALEEELGTTLVSFCYVELSERPSAGILSVGHPRPWLLRDGVAEEINVPNNALFGVGTTLSSAPRSQVVEIDVCCGDLLVFYTDGLTEARLSDGRQFGEGPLQAFLSEVEPGSRPVDVVVDLSKRLHSAVRDLQDDLILAVLRRD